MKPSSFKTTLACLALSGALLLPPQIVRAQAPAENPTPGSPPREEPRISFVIKNGLLEWGGETNQATVGNVIQNLRDRTRDTDFVLSPGVAEIAVSNLTLRAADLRGALEAIAMATGNKVRVGLLGKGNVYALTLGQAKRPELGVEAFNLSPILDLMGPRDSDLVRRQIVEINTLIVQTLKSFDARTEQQRGTPLLNFNENTGLLVIIGHPEQLEIARKIVQALTAPIGAGVPAATPNPFKKPAETEATPKAKSPSEPRPTTP